MSVIPPVNFTLTLAAERTLSRLAARSGLADPIPAILWIEKQDDDGAWVGAPGIGLYERKNLPADAIHRSNGVEFVFPHGEPQASFFAERVVDAISDRLRLIDAEGT